MPDLIARFLVLGGVAAIALVVAGLATRRRRATQPPAEIDGLGLEAAVVAFTSTDCSNCKKVMRMLGGLGVRVREVAYELEPALFDSAGVDGVPLVVVLEPDGSRSAQFGGKVNRRRLQRALSRAGW